MSAYQVEHACGVSSESGHLSQRRVAPDDDLVLGVAVSADQLVGTLGPRQVTHLGEEEGGLLKSTPHPMHPAYLSIH